MAKALIKAVDYTHPDPETDRVAAHKRGDIIVVMPDTHVWGTSELDTNKFVIVDVPDAMLAQDLGRADLELASERVFGAARKLRSMARVISKTSKRATVRRHRFKVDLDDTLSIQDKRRI